MRALARELDIRVFGRQVEPDVPRLGWRELWALGRSPGLIWHAHRNNEMALGLLLKLLGRKVRLLYTRHSSTPPSFPTRWLMAAMDRVLALTPYMATLLGGTPGIVPHGVDLTRFRPPAARAAAWSALGLGGARGIGVIGRIREAKGQGDFVEAVTPLLAGAPEWRGVVVGAVKASDRAWAEALQQRAQGRVAFLPEQADVLPWYQGLSVLVHPSHSEGYSMVHLEAMAAGCCVVSSRLPYVPDLIEHGRTGLLYPPGDVAALRALLEEVLRDPARAEQLGRNAAEEARQRLGLDTEARRLREEYEALSSASLARRPR